MTQATPVPVAKTPAVKTPAEDIIETTSRLIELMERETQQLKAMKASTLAQSQTEKDRLARSFETKMRQLAADKAAAAQVTPALRQELKATMDRFKAVMHAHELALRAARDANERVVRSILDAAQTQAGPAHAYAANGRLGAAANTRTAPVPIALDRRL